MAPSFFCLVGFTQQFSLLKRHTESRLQFSSLPIKAKHEWCKGLLLGVEGRLNDSRDPQVRHWLLLL